MSDTTLDTTHWACAVLHRDHDGKPIPCHLQTDDALSETISDAGSVLDWLSDEGLLDWVSVEADCE